MGTTCIFCGTVRFVFPSPRFAAQKPGNVLNELAQRTNQMNFSGKRYPRQELQQIALSAGHETFVLSCAEPLWELWNSRLCGC